MISEKKKKRSSPKFRVIFRPKSEFQTFFFLPKLGDLQKKKKKKRSSPKFRVIFRASPKFRVIFRPISQIQTFEGGRFSYGGSYFPFFTENRPQKHKKHAILHTSQANEGGSSPNHPPWLRYWLQTRFTKYRWIWLLQSFPSILATDI